MNEYIDNTFRPTMTAAVNTGGNLARVAYLEQACHELSTEVYNHG